MKSILTVFTLAGSLAAVAQDLAPIKVNVSTMKKPRVNDVIVFEEVSTKKTYEGKTNTQGFFTIKVPGGATYLIKIKGLGEEEEYSKVEVPALEEGEAYGEMELNVSYEPAKVFTLNNVHFETAKATLKKDSYKELNELVAFLKTKIGVEIEIAGHTDDVGADKANLLLSENRAKAVRQYLLSKGIAPNRVKAKGYGETEPVAKNDTPEGRAKNRRTEVRILKDE